MVPRECMVTPYHPWTTYRLRFSKMTTKGLLHIIRYSSLDDECSFHIYKINMVTILKMFLWQPFSNNICQTNSRNSCRCEGLKRLVSLRTVDLTSYFGYIRTVDLTSYFGYIRTIRFVF